jgi:DNA-binding FrmR family transcriptional regulator
MGYYAHMDVESRKAIDRRLARVEGQIRGLRRMVEEDSYCCDILTQLAATRSALDQVGAELATSHVRNCIVGHGCGTEHENAKPMSQEELLDELRVTLSRLVR